MWFRDHYYWVWVFLTGLLFCGSVRGVVINIPADQPTIQAGIDSAIDGDEVVVAPGTYLITATIDFLGKAITLRSVSGDPNDTILDGQGSVFHVVQCVNGEDSNTVLSGFTITGGNANSTDHTDYTSNGGGMFNRDSGPTITHCIFRGNFAADFGGGISNQNSHPVIRDCDFSNNTSDGMYNAGNFPISSSPFVSNCTFKNNTGAGMYNVSSSPVIQDCQFNDNISRGIHNANSSKPKILNCDFSGKRQSFFTTHLHVSFTPTKSLS
ncbi:MAG: right-handed parallel beta-helix repeat-containing protein [Candidatus Marinimicrobia bacterium]|nr:right-handed parallel beta-helix repeat-containing protein [Candidatus Neomarinimicrobiota bacterium]